MFRRVVCDRKWRRSFSVSSGLRRKVALLGANTYVGQYVAMLLKLSPEQVTCLALYDRGNTKGLAADLSHINTSCSLFEGNLSAVITGADLIIVQLDPPPVKEPEAQLEATSFMLRGVGEHIARINPKALIAVATEPLNITVPVLGEVLKINKVFDPNRLFGITKLHDVRMRSLIGKKKGIDPSKISIPVVGGQTPSTIVPLFTYLQPHLKISDSDIIYFLMAIQSEDVKPITAAYGIAIFVNSLLKALNGDSSVVEPALVASELTQAKYFSSRVLLGKGGVEQNLAVLEKLSPFEGRTLKAAEEELISDYEKAKDAIKTIYCCKNVEKKK